jgi:hypothetical protein
MRVQHHDMTISIEDSWWEAAGMRGFNPTSSAYSVDGSSFQGRRICMIPIIEVAAPRRSAGVPIFNDSVDESLPAAKRVIRILRGFADGAAIPPVEIVRTLAGPLPYKLTHGLHRFCCSVAVGFTYIPAILGFDWETLDQLEMHNDDDLC